MKYPRSIHVLIDLLSHLPSVGPKTAERYVFYLLKQNDEELQKLAQAIAELKERTLVCRICLAVAEKNPCEICTDKKRNQEIICVVANTRDMLAIEATKVYSGQYHILGGVINPIEEIGPDDLNIKKLVARIKNSHATEVILALNPNMEGETTSAYLKKLLKSHNIKVTRLARGLPTGADLEYTDQLTLSNALKNRNVL